MTVLTDVEKALDKVQHPFMIKTLSKVGIEEAFFNIIKAIYERPTANTHSMEKTQSFPTKDQEQDKDALSHLFNIVLEVLATAIRQEKAIKGIQIRKGEVKLSLFADRVS